MPVDGLPPEQVTPRIGIITALEKEFAAVEVLLENVRPYTSDRGARRRYTLGEIRAADGGKHSIALTMADQGNNKAAISAVHLYNDFPYVSEFIMVGIAGGVPYADKPDEHVRLGDIVVSELGVVQYDFGKDTNEKFLMKDSPILPSARMVQAVKFLKVTHLKGTIPWLEHIERAVTRLPEASRPKQPDILYSTSDSSAQIRHPKDPKRRKGEPRVFYGLIASANMVLKNPVRRDKLRDEVGAKAVEMEGSGVADAAWSVDAGCLVIRGICDYCDSHKRDNWQEYAAVVAASYTKALLESMDTLPEPFVLPQPRDQFDRLTESDSIKSKEDTIIPVYSLDLQNDDEHINKELGKWRFVSVGETNYRDVANGILHIGTTQSSTFNLSPVHEIKNCRVKLDVRIIEDGGNETHWAGVRLRGFDYHISLGYLVYLRRTGSVELHRTGKILAGEREIVVSDTKNKWTSLCIDIFDHDIWIYVDNNPHKHVRDDKLGGADAIFLHTFGTHAQFRNFHVFELASPPHMR
jgi:nucleoside phosphorylase